ncbi:MAG TPA: hypothetical protein VGL12_18940, partial [Roseiarcus sp.]
PNLAAEVGRCATQADERAKEMTRFLLGVLAGLAPTFAFGLVRGSCCSGQVRYRIYSVTQ